MKRTASTRPRIWKLITSASLLALAAAATVSGCGWYAGTSHSVRFNPYRSEIEMGRLPPLPKYDREAANKLFRWPDGRFDDWKTWQATEKAINELWDSTVEFGADGLLAELRSGLRSYLDKTQERLYSRQDYGLPDLQKRRNSAFDKLDALGQLEKGADQQAIRAYLAARSEYDSDCKPEVVLKHLDEARKEPRLRDNADYLTAALRISGDMEAAKEFERLAARYPASEKREAALYMAAVLAMKSSQSYQPQQEETAADSANVDRDEHWHKAQARFKRVIAEYPDGHLYSDSQGWIARLYLLVGDRASALAQYYRMLADRHEAGRVEALFSLGIVRWRASDADLEKLQIILDREPAAALAYSYHNIYNFSLRSDYSRYRYDEEPEADSEQANNPNGVTRKERLELERIASFAMRMMNRFPSGSVGSGFVVRVAQTALELGKLDEASRLARRALKMGARGELRAEAHWVAGVADFRRRQFPSARRSLMTLIAENPDNRYTEGARRQLAMIEEDTGNLEGALDQYLALDYRHDVAYFIDVLMTPAQLASFIEKSPMSKHRDELLYALGIRHLRDRRWKEARDVFAKIKPLGRDADSEYRYKYDSYYTGPDEPVKNEPFDKSIRRVRVQWIDQDIRTANDLERLEREIEAAQGDEARAEALYQVASYQYERSLLFYNPLAWNGIRHYLLVDLDERGAFRQPNESQLLFDYMQRHDMAANALPIFLEVVRRFPNTRAARDALYTAALCHERLRNYNAYWRSIYEEGGHAGERMVEYRNVRAAYPGYSFPLGSYRWEPATRTVNGGPAWVKPPKPRPRPSRWARAAQMANPWVIETFKLVNRVLGGIEYVFKQAWLATLAIVGWVLQWIWRLTMIGCIWFLWRRARRARTLMRAALAECNERPIDEFTASSLTVSSGAASTTFDKYLGHDLRDHWVEAGRDLIYKLRQVAQRQGSGLIVRFAITHLLFNVLLIHLIVNW